MVDSVEIDDAAKVRLLMRRLSNAAYTKYANYILPKNPGDPSFGETVAKLKQVFAPNILLFNIHYKCLQLSKF